MTLIFQPILLLKNILALPSFIMGENGMTDFEAHSSITKIIHAALGDNKSILKWSHVFVKEKYPYL